MNYADADGPFSRADFDLLARHVVEAWQTGIDQDWSALAGTLEWSCLETADHSVDAVLAVGLFLASRKLDGYPEWGWPETKMGARATPVLLIEALEAVARVLSALVAAAEPGTRAVIWRYPEVATGAPDDFAARGALEMVLHAHDVCAGIGVTFAPPDDVCARLREHTRSWPHWSMPGWSALPATDTPWSDLLQGSGRAKGDRAVGS